MARAKKGTEGYTGKVGNTVTYDLKGQSVKRSIGISTKPPTVKQLKVRQKTALVTELLRPVKEFIRIGFDLETRKTLLSPYNKATSVAKLKAIKGEYPDQDIDFSKVQFSSGNMPVNPNVSVKVLTMGLEFHWDIDFLAEGIKWNDNIMVLAYVPEKRNAYFHLSGARRIEGMERLTLPRFNETVKLEIYVSFISADRKSICNSIFVGELLW